MTASPPPSTPSGWHAPVLAWTGVAVAALAWAVFTSALGQRLASGPEGASPTAHPAACSEPLVIEIDPRGWIGVQNAQLSAADLAGLLRQRRDRLGEFPVLIHADPRTRHGAIRAVLDVCAALDLEQVRFLGADGGPS